MKKFLLLSALFLSGTLLASPESASEAKTPSPRDENATQRPIPPNGEARPPRPHDFDKAHHPEFHGNQDKMRQRRAMMAARWQEIALAMSKLSKENPEEYKRLKELRSTNPPAFIQEIRKYLPRPKVNSEIIKIDTECRELAAKIRAAKSNEEKAELEKQLKQKLHEGFELMIANATERVERIQKQIQELKEQEETIINDRFEMLMQPKP